MSGEALVLGRVIQASIVGQQLFLIYVYGRIGELINPTHLFADHVKVVALFHTDVVLK